VIFSGQRLLLSTAVLSALLSCPVAVLSQSPSATSASLPEEPQPQGEIIALASAPAEPFSSSVDISYFPQSQDATPTQTPAAPATDAEKKKAAEEESQRELHQRMLIVPNFNAVLDGSALPLTPRQKMRAAFHSAIDPYQFGLALLTSGYGQATDSHSSIDPNGTHHGYGQGWAGFGERYGANYVDQFNGTIIGNGVLPVLLHQDPRYYRMGTGSFKKRLLYSLSTTVRCKGDNGKWQPSYSNVLGNLVAGGISNLYYPKAERGFGLTIEQGFEVTAEGSIGALLIEFYPDIKQHFMKKHPVTP
jgi:hypothetical protein